MKKFTLFLVAMFAMVNVATAQRAWAYDLGLTSGSESYTFSFKAVTAANATLVFYKEGVETGTLDLGSVDAGQKTVTKTSAELLEVTKSGGDFTWGVKMTGSAINEGSALTQLNSTLYYNMMGIAADKDPESKDFGKVYLQMSYNGKPTNGTTKQTSGFFVYDPVFNLLSTANTGIRPILPSGYTFDGSDRLQFHRVDIDPKTGNLVFCYSVPNKPGVFSVSRDNLTGSVTNLLSGVTGVESIKRTNALCFDPEGTLYIIADVTTASQAGNIYKISDGVATKLTLGGKKIWIDEQVGIVSDGRGGLWVAQNRSGIVAASAVFHVNVANDVVDFVLEDGKEYSNWFKGGNGNNCRGGIAYYAKENILATHSQDAKVSLFKVTYDEETGVPTITKWLQGATGGKNTDAIAFDYAGDLYTGNSSGEYFKKFAVPTNNNTCTTPAPKAQTITLVAATPEHTVTINKIGEGTVTGANTGTYLQGSELELTANPAEHYTFTGWTGDVESTDNPLTVTVDGDKTITANFVKNQYTLTVSVNDGTKGSVNLTSGTYEAEEEVEIIATANTNYEFTGWSNGSKENPLTIAMEEDTELTANFRAILPTSITLNAHPVKDYSASIVGTMKRAIQNGENTIVLTHEVNGTPHIYNIAHATKTVTEISQEGVNAAADGFLSISDIAVTEDGKLVACNYVHCTFTPSNTSYFYIWNDLAAAPSVWFTSQKSGNYNDAYMGYTMALKGTSQNAEVTISAFNKSNSNTRYSHLYVVDRTYSDASYKYSRDNAALHPNTLGPNSYELNASPLAAGKWIVDGELSSPIEFVEKDGVAIDTYTALSLDVLGKKYNGASYLFHNDHHLMIAPYAADDKLAGVKVLGITDGFGSPVQVETNTALVNAIDATTAAATAYVDGDDDLTIYLFADSKVFTFSEKVYTAQTFTVTATAGEGGTVEGGGPYEENTTARLTATPDEHYTFAGWSGDVTSTDNPLIVTVDGDLNITASFTEDPKSTITVTSDDENMGTVSGSGTYYEGETVTLSAISKGGYTFVKWNDEETAATRTITVEEDDATYTAYFKQATPRAWAYDLRKVENAENYDFTFKTTSAGTATLIFKNKDGNILDFGTHTAAATTAEEKTITIAKTTFEAATQDIYWEVQMDGEAITKMAEVTDPTKGIYSFYLPQGVAVDNCTDSKYFGRIYLAEANDGGSDGQSDRTKAQKRGIFMFDQELADLNPTANVGVLPANAATAMTATTRHAIHRIAVNPTDGQVAFAYNIEGSTAIWSMEPEDMTANASNLINGADDITRASSLCFDEKGILYVMNNANTGTTGGQIYKVENGVATLFAAYQAGYQWAVDDNAMAADGRGGLWIAQSRWGYDYPLLTHVNKEGAVDFAVKENLSDWFPNNNTGVSYRGQCAYNAKEDILAFVGNRVVALFKVEYDANGKPTLTEKLMTTVDLNPNASGNFYIDGVAFDYAGDLYVASASTERLYKFVVPTNDNTCTVPAPKSEFIEKEQKYAVTVEASPAEGGSVSGGGEYTAGETITLTATANTGYRFVNWTKGSDEESTDASFSYTVPAEGVTLIANFELITYTLITSTNDENKGTVSVDGVCTHGSTVTLTATAKPGYKLLYWSDRSTDNPRTITMTKNEAISAYFVKDYAEEPTFTITKMWENTNVPASTADGYQAVGWDGKIYMQNKTAGKIITYSSAEDTGTEYATSGLGQQIAVDEAGNLIVFNESFADATPSAILIYQNGSTTGKAVTFTLKDPARCDFFSASGDIYSAEGGYVYFYCAGKTVINRLKITNGATTAADVTTDVVGEAVYSSPQNTNYVMVDIFGNLVAHARSNAINAINVYTNESKAFTLPSIKMGTLGGCSFELGGKELWAYHAGASNYSSEWNIYNMTDGKFLSDDDFYAVDKTATTNYAANWLNVQVVDENTAYIYQFCPKKAVALWKVTLERNDLQKYTVTATANDASMGSVTGSDTYYENATATLTATANAGYKFVNWTQAGVEVSTNATYTFTVTEDVELVANFAPLPEITYDLNGGVWNQYDWTSKKDMYDAFVAEWKTYSSSSQSFCSYETQLGIGNSNQGLPTAILSTQPILEFMAQAKWAWLGQFLDALATAQGKATKPTEAVLQMRFGLGNFFGEDNNGAGASSWIGAVDCSGDIASITAFAPYWGQTFPMPTQPTEEVVLGSPYKEGYLFDGWYANSDFSGAVVTTVDANTDGTLYAKWKETIITVTIDEDVDNTTNLAPHIGKKVTATVTRSFNNDSYKTITLPFSMDADQITAVFGDATVFEFINVIEGPYEINLRFRPTSKIVAGTPYIIALPEGEYDAKEGGFTIEDVVIDTELRPITFGNITMQPVLDGGDKLTDDSEYWLATDNYLYNANDPAVNMPGLRAYFISNSPLPIRARVVYGENEETELPIIQQQPENNVRKIMKDGQIIIIRGEQQYNVQGQRIE